MNEPKVTLEIVFFPHRIVNLIQFLERHEKRKDGTDRAKARQEIGGHLWEFLEIQRSFPWAVSAECTWSLYNFTRGIKLKLSVCS